MQRGIPDFGLETGRKNSGPEVEILRIQYLTSSIRKELKTKKGERAKNHLVFRCHQLEENFG